MYVLKIDFPTGIAYFTGKKKVVQGSESPGLTDMLGQARLFETEEEAAKFCKMLIKKYDMEFYYTDMDAEPVETSSGDDAFILDIADEISDEIEKALAEGDVAGEDTLEADASSEAMTDLEENKPADSDSEINTGISEDF